MKSYVCLITAIITCTTALAQHVNLVPNPGFEAMTEVPCDPMYGEMSRYISGWQQGSQGTADILTKKSAPSCYANPNSTHTSRFGTENPHSGDAMGLIITSGPQYREYLGSTLSQPLEVGRKYCAEVYVTHGEFTGICTNNIGFLFRTGEYSIVSGYEIFDTPQVNWTGVVANNTGWVKVSGTFTADKPYTNFIIGNFLSDAATSSQRTPGGTGMYSSHAAYYIDDVSIRLASDLKAVGDSVVTIGTTATLTASGGKDYKWVDVKNPNVVLGTDAVLKTKVDRKTTYRVSCGDDFVELTVDVRKQVLNYITELEGRKVRKGRTVIVHNEEIKIVVHDKNEVDGDSIALYYGDSLIVEHVALTHKKQTFTIKVDKENPTQLILFAENLGSVPPNTAALTVKDGKDETDITLGSDFRFCDSIMLQYKAE